MHFITNGYKRFLKTNSTDPRQRVPLRPSHTVAITQTIAKRTHSIGWNAARGICPGSFNQSRACIVNILVAFSLSGPVWPGLYSYPLSTGWLLWTVYGQGEQHLCPILYQEMQRSNLCLILSLKSVYKPDCQFQDRTAWWRRALTTAGRLAWSRKPLGTRQTPDQAL